MVFSCHHPFVFLPTITPDSSDTPFREIAEKFGTLSKELKSCTDPARRIDLLKEFRAVLAEADRIAANVPKSRWER